ncbi:MAG TPA: MurR/RpiR family transcriptional regulator [Symbiobacteriaceae bacterium]|nr:MurR/RpiR family transcriptional regulator [Symbiobacteriaceae bacterium]
MRFEERVHQFEYKLTDTDDQIVAYILKNKAAVVTLSIQRLAEIFFTVPNTLSRLSKKLGYDGFSQLKNSLKDEIHGEQAEPQDSLQSNIRKTFELIDPEKMAIVARMIHGAGRVLLFGVGDTAPFCALLAKHLKIAEKEAEFHVHRHETMEEIELLTAHDLLFIISLSGETAQVLEIAQLGKRKGVPIISLTHFSRNTLQGIADVNLYCHSPRKMIKQYNVTDKAPLMVTLRELSEYYWRFVGLGV